MAGDDKRVDDPTPRDSDPQELAGHERLEMRSPTSPMRSERQLAAQDREAAVQERRAAAHDLDRISAYLRLVDLDELTGALQRGPGLVELRRAVNDAHLHHTALVVAFVDVDHLKRVNDQAGHDAGDAMLRGTGFAMRKALRAGDAVVRYGGDEFLCVLAGVSLPEAAGRMDEVKAKLSSLVPHATISVGLAALRPGDTPEELVRRADQGMYLSRRRDDHLRRLSD